MAIPITEPGRLMRRPLRRSRRQRVVAGVCGGLAQWLGWDVIVVRLLFVLVAVVSSVFPALLAYATLWLVIPEDPSPRDRIRDLWDEFY